MGSNASKSVCDEGVWQLFNGSQVASVSRCAKPLDQSKLAQKQRDQNGWSKDECSDRICYAAAAVQLVAFANSRIYMADYKGAQQRYRKELNPDGITEAILVQRQKSDKNLQKGGRAYKLIPEAYPYLETKQLNEMSKVEEVLRSSTRPILMSFCMTGYAWKKFYEKDRSELIKGTILSHEMARDIAHTVDCIEKDPTEHAKMLEKKGHAVAVMFLAEKKGKPLLAVKNSWGTETHAIKGWLLIEAEAAQEFHANFWDVYWTIESLKKHPRHADLLQQFQSASEEEKRGFVEYRKDQYRQCLDSCREAISTKMGANHGITFPSDRLEVFQKTVCRSARPDGGAVPPPAQATPPSSLSGSIGSPLPVVSEPSKSEAPPATILISTNSFTSVLLFVLGSLAVIFSLY